MAESSEPKIWGLATASDFDAVFRGADIAITCQDAGLTYTAAMNAWLVPPHGENLIGFNDDALLAEKWGEDLLASKRRVAQSGQAESIDVHFQTADQDRWYHLTLGPVSINGSGRGVLAASIDITAQKTVEEHLRLALLELAHRSKNLLAVVLSVARQSADDSRDLSDFRVRFLGRIRSLAVAHDILTEEAWRGATVFSLVRSQLSAFSETALKQSRIDGHNAFLKPNAVQYVGLALHEVIALSVLSGALSVPEGTVDFASRVQPATKAKPRMLCLTWHETGGAARPREGASQFGEALLSSIVPAALGGDAKLNESAKQGLTYELRIPETQFY